MHEDVPMKSLKAPPDSFDKGLTGDSLILQILSEAVVDSRSSNTLSLLSPHLGFILVLFVIYHKLQKFSDARKFAAMYLKFKQSGQTFGYFVKKNANGIANSDDPD